MLALKFARFPTNVRLNESVVDCSAAGRGAAESANKLPA